MSVTATSSGSLRSPLLPIGANTFDAATNTFTLANDTDTGDNIAMSSFATGPGRFGTFSVKVAHPASTPDFSVRLAWEVLNAVGAVIDSSDDHTPGPVRTNLATTPGPATTTGWASNDTTLFTTTFDAAAGRRAGTGAKKTVRTAANPSNAISSLNSTGSTTYNVAGRIPCAAGEVWTFSVYLKCPVPFRSYCGIEFYTAANVKVGATVTAPQLTGAANEWVRPNLTFTVPAGATNMGIINLGSYLITGTTVGGETSWAADCLWEKTNTLNPYFDGSYSPDPLLVPAWTGTPGASTSELSVDDRTVVTLTEKLVSIDLPVAPAGATARKVYVQAASAPPAIVPTARRKNLYPGARCSATTLTDWEGVAGWPITARNASGLPPLLKSYAHCQCNAPGSAANRGVNWWQSPTATTPTAARGLPVNAGWIYTVSLYVFLTKPGPVVLSLRFFTGTTWSAAKTDAAPVTVPANTWTRLNLTVTAPAGATYLCGSVLSTSTITYTTSDIVGVSALLLSNSSTLYDYFDGANMGFNTPPGSVAWDGPDPDVYTSTLYVDNQPVRKLAVSGDLLATQASAEALISANLERNLRRSVAEIFNSSTARIAAGTPALLSGSLTFLCATYVQAAALDALHQTIGTITLSGEESSELAGLQYVAIETNQLTAEEATPGLPSKWLLQVEIREQP